MRELLLRGGALLCPGARPALEAYLRTVEAYRQNEYGGLAPALRERVARAWGRFFDAWGYRA